MTNKKSSVPKYVQLANILRDKIVSGEIKIGDKLPSENEMAKKYSIGRLTVREALSVLSNEGYVESWHGKGTFCKSCMRLPKFRIDVMLNLSDAYFVPHYLHTICAGLETKDASVVLHDTKNNDARIAQCLEKILSEGTNGVIFQPSSGTMEADESIKSVLGKFENAKVPYIMIDAFYEGVPESYVIMNEKESGAIAANYLKSLGHKNFCMVVKSQNTDSRLRLDGFCESLRKKPLVIEHDEKFEEHIANLLENHREISAVFCYNDSVAEDVLKVLTKMGVRVPDNVSLVSVDDTDIASVLSLTSVVHQKSFLAKSATEAMIGMITGAESWPYKKVFEPSLKIRKSCKSI